MKLLLDTCTFLWIVGERENLSPRAVELFESADHEVYLSAASAWEVGTKYAIRKLFLSEPPDRYIPAQREAHGILPLPIDEESALHAVRLPPLHKDPWDRMLIGQAVVHGLTILTSDRLITQYAVRTLW